MSPPTDTYAVSHYDPAAANDLAEAIETLLSANLRHRRAGDRATRALRLPVGLRNQDAGSAATVVFGTHQVLIASALTADPPVLLEGPADQLAALLHLRFSSAGLVPVGLASRHGFRLLAGVAMGRLRVRGFLRHPLTVLRFLALVSPRECASLERFCGVPH